jgi:hypothetical protein
MMALGITVNAGRVLIEARFGHTPSIDAFMAPDHPIRKSKRRLLAKAGGNQSNGITTAQFRSQLS